MCLRTLHKATAITDDTFKSYLVMRAALKTVFMRKFISKEDLETRFVMTNWLVSMFAMLFLISGCASDEWLSPNFPQSTTSQSSKTSKGDQTEPLVLREGDVVNITFPGSAGLDTTQQIRRDGKIVIPLIGEVTAAGLTPVELQDDLIKKYAPQVATKQIIVTIQS